MESINAIKSSLRDATYYLCMQLLLKSIGISLKNFKPLTCNIINRNFDGIVEY